MSGLVLPTGVGADILWTHVLGIANLGGINFGIGMWQFRRQFI